MGEWATGIVEKIDDSLASAREKEIRFFRIDEFKRNVTRIDSFSGSCRFCDEQKIAVTETVAKIEEAVEVPGKSRREYDRLISRLSKHMQKAHGFYAPFYFSYIYTAAGMATGLVIGFLLAKIYHGMYIEMLSAGFVAGLMPTYVLGYIKDKKIRKEKRLM